MRCGFTLILTLLIALAAMPVLPGISSAEVSPAGGSAHSLQAAGESDCPALVVRSEDRPIAASGPCRTGSQPVFAPAVVTISGLCLRGTSDDGSLLPAIADTSLYSLHCKLAI